MPDIEIRPLRRSDREQVTDLVNRHAAAVVPGVSASVNTVLSQFEREPGEFVVDPWVAARRAVVGVQGGAVVAAALVSRFRDADDVGTAFAGCTRTGHCRCPACTVSQSSGHTCETCCCVTGSNPTTG